MLKQIVENYSVVSPISGSERFPQGKSAAPKELIFHILDDNTTSVAVLDIGFGEGQLGKLIKANPATAHWAVDGVDGYAVNCSNGELFAEKLYRNVWHGLAQDIPSEQFKQYKILCLLDVIEHLSAETAKWLLRTLLASMADDAFLFISTPLWFYPQETIQPGDLEEHLIGVPATSMLALMPKIYAVNPPLIGGFVLGKRSLDFIEFFQPTTDKHFSYEKGLAIANVVNCQHTPGVVFKYW
ncbi:class I SAM-dependent methyltransferase [Paraburkholderia lycopersici]|uniref:Methyltransferase domain-containing protein n=1 Tax=Paraburkholderia lycopersici TaxID=416944 RepID=A0A1G6T7T2_9BURK|nr:methyltransferase domain-containing protein [Paraburkholderia lycopersici]SDD24507.1 Methyltransferase domain-containing protein [Paraburkholderia lycopersici]